MTDTNESFGIWAILELMGHVKVAGFVTEEELFGTKVGRIDIPKDDDKSFTQYFGGQSVYRLTPVTEDVARMFALRNQPRPVCVYELQLPESTEASTMIDTHRIILDDDGNEVPF